MSSESLIFLLISRQLMDLSYLAKHYEPRILLRPEHEGREREAIMILRYRSLKSLKLPKAYITLHVFCEW